ncbi:unnamed protein product [Absidia cylindrospora]
MQTSRLSLPILWNSSNVSSEHISSPISSPSYLSSSTTLLWPYSVGNLPPAYTSTCDSDQKKNGLGDIQQQQHQSLESLSQTPYHLASYTQTTPSSLNRSSYQTDEQQWHGSKDKPANSCVDWLAPSSYTSSCHPLRNIWSISSMEQQQPSHQRRFSLSSDQVFDNYSVSDGHQRNWDQIHNYGRRHSLAGPLTSKPANHSNNNSTHARQTYPGLVNSGYAMNAIGELDTCTYDDTQHSRKQQLVLNRRVLDHINEYFGGNKGERNYYRGDHSSPFCTTPYSLDHGLQQQDVSSMSATAMGPYSNNMGKTMTAGGDAANYGSSTVLMGKGIPLHHFLDSNTMLYRVEFKANRTDIYYTMQGEHILPHVGDLVIVEADRGHDLGKVIAISTANDIIRHQQQRESMTTINNDSAATDEDPFTEKEMVKTLDTDDSKLPEMLQQRLPINSTEVDHVTGPQQWYAKRLYRLADVEEKKSLTTKKIDEENALMVCQTKTQQKELPMQVVNAEYQWDRRKLTFYFVAEQRIDFRELVRELFKNYKTRIWMCALKSNSNGDPSTVE